jgi:hypothetical protein
MSQAGLAVVGAIFGERKSASIGQSAPRTDHAKRRGIAKSFVRDHEPEYLLTLRQSLMADRGIAADGI